MGKAGSFQKVRQQSQLTLDSKGPPLFQPSGHLVYVHQGVLFPAPMNLDRLEVTGQPSPILEDVLTDPTRGFAQFALSHTGLSVRLTGSAVQNSSIAWMDSSSQTQPLLEVLQHMFGVSVSPALQVGIRAIVTIRTEFSQTTTGDDSTADPISLTQGKG